MEKNHPVEEILGLTMDKLRDMVDVNTVIGDPIHTPEGITVIPVSRISVGLISGGSDFATKNQPANGKNAYGGASSAGINIMPLGFLIINGDSARMLPVEPPPGGPLNKALDMMPDLMAKVSNILDQRKAAKSAKQARGPVIVDGEAAKET